MLLPSARDARIPLHERASNYGIRLVEDMQLGQNGSPGLICEEEGDNEDHLDLYDYLKTI